MTMKLCVNLFPALGYALATMFSNMAGLTSEVKIPHSKQQLVCLPAANPDLHRQNSSVTVEKDGALRLSNGSGSDTLVWKIPYAPGQGGSANQTLFGSGV